MPQSINEMSTEELIDYYEQLLLELDTKKGADRKIHNSIMDDVYYKIEGREKGREADYDRDQERPDYSFRDPGGKSALRNGPRRYPCPTCERPNVLSQADKNKGYQCDRCADIAEGSLRYEY